MLDQREWVVACRTGDIDEEDVMRFDHRGATYAVYHIEGGFYASDGWCTHEKAHLADGLVLGDAIDVHGIKAVSILKPVSRFAPRSVSS